MRCHLLCEEGMYSLSPREKSLRRNPSSTQTNDSIAVHSSPLCSGQPSLTEASVEYQTDVT